MTHTTLQPANAIFIMPAYHPGLTWGLGNRAAYTPGPGGPTVDNRRLTNLEPGPIKGRVGALSILRAFSPGNLFPQLNPYPQQVVNNSYATALFGLYVPGWRKPAPTAVSGF